MPVAIMERKRARNHMLARLLSCQKEEIVNLRMITVKICKLESIILCEDQQIVWGPANEI